MATLVQKNSGTGTSTTLAVNLASAVGSGDCLMMMLRLNAAPGTIVISDTINLTTGWSLAFSQLNTNGNGGIYLYIRPNSGSGANVSITVTLTNSVSIQAIAADYSGLTTTPLIAVATANIASPSASVNSSPVTAGWTNILVVGGVANETANSLTFTSLGESFVAEINQGGNLFFCDVQPSAAGAYTLTGTYSSSVSWQSGVAAFKTSTSVQQTCVTPVASPVAGSYSSTQSVTLSTTTTGAAIYYTTDGTNPTSGSTLYTGAISISSTTTLKAIAILATYVNSAVFSGVYTIATGGGIGTVKTSGAGTPATVANSSGFSWPITSPTISGKIGQPIPVIFCDSDGNELTVTGSTKGGQIGGATPVCLCTPQGKTITPTITLTSNGHSIVVTATKTGVNRGRPIPVVLTDLNGFAYVTTSFSAFGAYLSNPTPICLTDVNGNVLTLLAGN